MKTRPLLPLAAIALLSLSGCFRATESASGETAVELHRTKPFEEVELLGVGDVTVVPGDDYAVTVTTDATFIDGVEVKVADGALGLNEHYDFDTRGLDVDFLVTVPSLGAVSLAGAGTITVSGLDAETFSLTLTGAGEVVVSGTTSTLKVLLAGVGNIDTTGLDAGIVDVGLSGAGDIDVGPSDSLTVSLAGVGNITYDGNPEVTSTISGVGSIGPS
jgi:hypothetical protein